MFVLVHKDRVVVGPMPYNLGIFEGALEKLRIKAVIPRLQPEEPFIIDNDTKITTATVETPAFNTRTERIHGPYWDLSGMYVKGWYEVAPKDLEFAKGDMAPLIAANRYTKEIAGVKVTVKDTEVTLDTSREQRDRYAQKYLLMENSDTINWKFPEGWLQLSKADLKLCVDAVNQHVQSSFDWELNILDQVNNATTLEQLNDIEL